MVDLLRLFPRRVVASRRHWMVEHLHQALPDARFDLGAVARDFDLSVFVPRIAQATGAVEGQSACRYPIHLERLAPFLPLSLRSYFLLFLLELLRWGGTVDGCFLFCWCVVDFPEDGPAC